MFASADTQRRLIEACNLLCEHAASKLPSGWAITLMMSRDEATIELTNPAGEGVETEAADYGISTLDDLCELAQELERADEQDKLRGPSI